MKATISLKQLRANPREYIRLLNSGYEVEITEHRKPIGVAIQPPTAKKTPPGNTAEILRVIRSLPKIKTPYPEIDTVELIKKTRLQAYEEKYGELKRK